MKVMIDIGHPAHVHFFKHTIRELEKQGHKVKLTARDKDVTLALLDAYGFEYVIRGKLKGSLISKATDMFRVDLKVLEVAKEFKPDLMIGIHNPYIAHVSKILKIPSITFTDSEPVPIADLLTFPFTSVVITPTTYRKKLGKKHRKVNSFKELAYLHPKYFTPDPKVLQMADLKSDEKFAILRFVSWKASHDVEKGGFSDANKQTLVDTLKPHAKVFISSEGKLPESLEPLRLTVPPHKFHDLLAFATLLVTDSQTVTTEAACLGTPVVRCNSFVGENDMGNFIELEKKYGLIFSLRDPKDAIKRVGEMIQIAELKGTWKNKVNKMLSDKIDIAEYLVDTIEEWPKNARN